MSSFLKLNRILALSLVAAGSGFAQFTVHSGSRTYTLTVSSQAGGFTFAGHWLYEMSAILPSAQTGYSYDLLFSSNLTAGSGTSGEAIFLIKSSDGYTFTGTPTAVLEIDRPGSVSNICDMADARPIWDGSLWHVYVQASVLTGGSCPTVGPNYIFEATGPSLYSLSWVKTPGTNNAQAIVTSRTLSGVGIGESQQWFYTGPYAGPGSFPFLVEYNDWNYTPGSQDFGYISANGTSSLYYWYNIVPAYSSGVSSLYPDVILGNSLDQASYGNPGLALGSDCTGNAQRGRGLGFYGNLVSGGPPAGVFVDGTFASSTPGLITSVRFGRNEYGYLDPVSLTTPRVWNTLVYYNASDELNGVACPVPAIQSTWNNSGHSGNPQSHIGVSKVTITEQ